MADKPTSVFPEDNVHDEHNFDSIATIPNIIPEDVGCVEEPEEKTDLESTILEDKTDPINNLQYGNLNETTSHVTSVQPVEHNVRGTNAQHEILEKTKPRKHTLGDDNSGRRVNKKKLLFTWSSAVSTVFVVLLLIGIYTIKQIIPG